MKAYQLHAPGDLRYEDVPTPECRPGWCLVRVKACGICSSDLPRILTKGTYHFPTIPGHEFAGVVAQVGDAKDAGLIGKKAGVFPLIPCRKCECCRQGRYELCANYDYLGSRRDGGFAEYAAVPVWNLIELEDGADLTEAAMMEPLAVSLHAVKRMDIRPGEDVAILGTGMIAFAAAQWALLREPASVTVIGRSEAKRQIAEGIPGIRYTTEQDGTNRYSAVLEAVGSNEAINRALDRVKPEGTVVLMGNPEGEIRLPQDSYWKILRKQLTVRGTWNSAYEKDAKCDWEEVREGLKTGRIRARSLVSHVFPQTELKEALDLMAEHREPYCKVMTLWNEE